MCEAVVVLPPTSLKLAKHLDYIRFLIADKMYIGLWGIQPMLFPPLRYGGVVNGVVVVMAAKPKATTYGPLSW